MGTCLTKDSESSAIKEKNRNGGWGVNARPGHKRHWK